MKPEDRKRLKQHIEMIVEHKMPIVFCPNCEKDVECIHTAELYECKECGEDFARYIVSRQPAKSDVSMTQDVLTDIKTGRSVENTNPDYHNPDYYNRTKTSPDNNKCWWTQESDPEVFPNLWRAGCGNSFYLDAEKPSDNHMKYCCYCGKEIAEGE